MRGQEREIDTSLSLSLSALVKCHRSVCIKFRWVQTIGVRSDFNQLGGRVCTARFLWTGGDRETRWNAIPRYDVSVRGNLGNSAALCQWWTMTTWRENGKSRVLVNGRMEEKVMSVSNRYIRYIGNRLEMELLYRFFNFRKRYFPSFWTDLSGEMERMMKRRDINNRE